MSIFELEWVGMKDSGKSGGFYWPGDKPRLVARGGRGDGKRVAMATPQIPQYRFFTSLIDLSNDVDPHTANPTLPPLPRESIVNVIQRLPLGKIP